MTFEFVSVALGSFITGCVAMFSVIKFIVRSALSEFELKLNNKYVKESQCYVIAKEQVLAHEETHHHGRV